MPRDPDDFPFARAEPESVRTRADLADFVRTMHRDLVARPAAWENATLEHFLEALAACCVDVEHVYRNRGEIAPAEPSWRHVAELLVMASGYE